MPDFTIVDLPRDCASEIINYLKICDIIYLRATCRYFRAIIRAKSREIWGPAGEGGFWRDLIRQSYASTVIITKYFREKSTHCDVQKVDLDINGITGMGLIGCPYFMTSVVKQFIFIPMIYVCLPRKKSPHMPISETTITVIITWYVNGYKIFKEIKELQHDRHFESIGLTMQFHEDNFVFHQKGYIGDPICINFSGENNIGIKIKYIEPEFLAKQIAEAANVYVVFYYSIEHMEKINKIFIGPSPDCYDLESIPEYSFISGADFPSIISNSLNFTPLWREKVAILRQLKKYNKRAAELSSFLA